VGAAGCWRRGFLRVSAESTEWSWRGRPIAFAAMAAEAGLRWPLFASGAGRLRLHGTTAALLERVTLRRHDILQASDHAYLDAGAAAGAVLVYHPRPWASLSLFAEGAFRPTRRQIDIPGGPSVALDAWSGRAGVGAGLAW
jgi:hypothetical protein